MPSRFFTVCVIVCMLVGWAWHTQRVVESLQHRVQVLEWACTPVNTGGGVEQCDQPNVEQTHSKVVGP